MLGRFGWKAGSPPSPSRRQAANGDIGISTTLIPVRPATAPKAPECLAAPNGNTPQYDNVEVGDNCSRSGLLFQESRRAGAA